MEFSNSYILNLALHRKKFSNQCVEARGAYKAGMVGLKPAGRPEGKTTRLRSFDRLLFWSC
jgi:hypothetical protein